MKRITLKLIALTMALLIALSGLAALAESYAAAVTASSLTIYADAEMTKSLGALPYHQIVTVKAVKGNVAQLTVAGTTVYASLDSLTAVEDIAKKATFNAAARVYEDLDTETARSVAVKKGTAVYVLAEKNGWAMVVKGTNVGYAETAYLTIDGEKPADTATPAPSATTVPTADTTIKGSAGVTIENIPAIVTAASLPVYKTASTASKLGTLSVGTAVTVTAYNNTWAYIKYNGKLGFCKLSGLRKATAADATTAPTENQINGSNSITKPKDAIAAKVSTDSLKVYKSATTSSAKLGTLKKGIEVSIIAYNSTWAYIELNGNYGYCLRSGLSKIEENNNGNNNNGNAVIGTATVITATAPVYTKASTSASSSKVTIGTTVDIYKYDTTWAYVGLNGKFGYMKLTSLSAVGYTEYEAGDSANGIKDMETVLLTLGYFDGVPSNSYDSQTTSAIERMQEACGMHVTGEADEATQRVLYGGHVPASPILSASLTTGTKNANVKRIQNRLTALGYLTKTSSVDGEYGTTTANAIKLFQSANGMTANGTANSTTIKALYSASAKSLPSGTKAADASVSTPTTGGVSGNTTTMPSTLASTTSVYSSSMSNASKLEYAIYVGQNQLGKPYVYGSSGPNSFDCSGFTLYCFKKIGVSLAHSAYSQGYDSKYTKVNTIPDLQRGDLVYFNTVSDSDLSDHAGIYLGAKSFIHASSGGGKVIVSTLASGYYNRNFSWGRRVFD